jgi:hypothetical protein
LPTITSTAGGALTLGSGIGLSDMITLTGGDLAGVYPGTLTVGLTGPPSATGPWIWTQCLYGRDSDAHWPDPVR